jgi:general stress protein 26
MTDAVEVYRAQAAPAAIEASLSSKTAKAVVGTLNEDGTTHLAFVIFLYEDGRFYFETSSVTKKARNAAARPNTSFAIEGPGFMAKAEGTARVIEGAEAQAINARLRAKYLTPEAMGLCRSGLGRTR